VHSRRSQSSSQSGKRSQQPHVCAGAWLTPGPWGFGHSPPGKNLGASCAGPRGVGAPGVASLVIMEHLLVVGCLWGCLLFVNRAHSGSSDPGFVYGTSSRLGKVSSGVNTYSQRLYWNVNMCYFDVNRIPYTLVSFECHWLIKLSLLYFSDNVCRYRWQNLGQHARGQGQGQLCSRPRPRPDLVEAKLRPRVPRQVIIEC